MTGGMFDGIGTVVLIYAAAIFAAGLFIGWLVF